MRERSRSLCNNLCIILSLKIHYYYKKQILATLILISCLLVNSTAQDSRKIISVDTSELSFSWDSSYVKLNKSVADKEYWFNILSEDTTLIAFFKIGGNKKPYYIYIASIEKISVRAYQYEFMIYSRPVSVSPKELSAFGYATYHITVVPQLKGKWKISEIKFNGIVI